MEALIELIKTRPWLIILVVFFIAEPVFKALKRRKAKQDTTLKGDTQSPSRAAPVRRELNPMFPKSNTLRSLDPASLYRDDNAAAWENDDFDEYDDDYDDFDEAYNNDDYNRR